MRAAIRCAGAAVVVMVAITAAAALAASPVKVGRCGYARSAYWGRVALYPWHMSCRAARHTLARSESRQAPTISFTADGAWTFDAEAVKIAGKWWVCGGRMGSYFCGYPYRPATAPGLGGGTTYKGPFTKEFLFQACQDGAYLCQRRDQIYQPPRSYHQLVAGEATSPGREQRSSERGGRAPRPCHGLATPFRASPRRVSRAR